jgi:AcrR family transcriptional regulator
MAKSTAKQRAEQRRGENGEPTKRRDSEVLDAAAKVFYSRGYAAASVQDIADELNILKGSLYHYIEKKEDLLFWLLKESHDDVESILAEIGASDLPPLEKLREYTRRQVEYTSRNLERMAIYYREATQLSADRHREIASKRRDHERFVAGLIAEAQATGEAKDGGDPALIANFVFGSMIWVYRWYKPGRDLPPAEVAAACADFVLDGVIGSR